MKCALCFDELPPSSNQLFCGPCRYIAGLGDTKSHKKYPEPFWTVPLNPSYLSGVSDDVTGHIVLPGATWPVRDDRGRSHNYERRCRECHRITMIEPGPGMLCGLCVLAWDLLKGPILLSAWMDEFDANCHVYFGNTIPLLLTYTS